MLSGIGVLLIGVAFLILAFFVAHVLNNLAGVLHGVEKTVERLPNQLDEIFKETGNLMQESNRTLADVNDKMEQLSPLVYILGDAGNVTRKFSSSLVDITESMKSKTSDTEEITKKNNVGGLYGSFALGYYWLKKRRQLKKDVTEGVSSHEQRNE
ncbi:DUF948 domain-containing protein [Virgibacillus halodenitrificans]|uniref:DUF948 domain-containing protein n=1 Tax=Virgibacillus halodenitrificans TaxID=1482 RepID=UPI0013717E41|nr:DUF948 domain-containing protein [Virgibacillus halodenitrificans]MYL47727.1 DUF948 domain-containing protein [Virgibacillus halodenitrificans]